MKKKVVLSVAVVVLVVMVAVMCVACTPTQKSVINKFTSDKNGYKLILGDENASVVTLSKSLTVSITITWYDNEDDAKKAYDVGVKAPLQSEKTVKRKGNAVAIGDEASIKLF